DEAIDSTNYLRLIDVGTSDDPQCSLEGKMADEYSEPAQHDALRFGEKLIAPIKRRLQRLLPRRRAAVSKQQQSKMLVEKGFGLMQAIGLDTPGGQLDRQRHTIKFAADTHDDRDVAIA